MCYFFLIIFRYTEINYYEINPKDRIVTNNSFIKKYYIL